MQSCDSGETVTNESITKFLGGLRDSSKQGFNDGIDEIIQFVNSDLILEGYTAASSFIKSIENGESLFFNPSGDYLLGIGNRIVNMSANDWAYAISNQIPVSALMYGTGIGISSLRFRSFKMPKFRAPSEANVFTEIMTRYGQERFILRGANGQFMKGTGTPTTISTYNRYLGLNSSGGANWGTPVNYSAIGGRPWMKGLQQEDYLQRLFTEERKNIIII